MTKSRNEVVWVCNTHGEKMNAFRVLVGKLEAERPLGRPRLRWSRRAKKKRSKSPPRRNADKNARQPGKKEGRKGSRPRRKEIRNKNRRRTDGFPRLPMDVHQERMMACLGKTEATDLETNSEEIETEAKHEKVPNERAAVTPVGGQRKRRRGRNLATELRRKPKELAQGNCGSRE
jgi:hypothetical protein